MRENEALKVLKTISKYTNICEDGVYFNSTFVKAYEVALKALEEIQQYRAIGLTPELIEAMRGHNIAMINDLEEYQAIGTVEELKALKDIDEDLRLKYCYEDLSNAENRGYCQGSNEAVDAFAKFLHEKAIENNGLRLSSETRSWTHPSIFDYLEEFKNEQICKEEVDCESEE